VAVSQRRSKTKATPPARTTSARKVSVRAETRVGETKRAVLRGLKAYTRKTIGHTNYKPLTFSLRCNGAICGGIVGHVWGNTLFVAFLWVDESLRGRDHGATLIRTIENEARKHGATRVYLDTLTYQAPAFYKKLGFSEFGRIDSFVNGHDRIWLTRPL
jgi:ribosomal protein S18 acetylase RimI-like enzyme